MQKNLFPFFIFLILLGSCDNIEKQYTEYRIDSNEELQEYLLNSWNTWNNPDLLNQVLMPEGLSIRISFRQTHRNAGTPYFLDQALVAGPANNFPLKVEPLLHTYDGYYTDMRISCQGFSARIQTATRRDDIFILYTPEELPEHPPLLVVEAGLLWNNKGMVEKKEGFFQADFGPKTFIISATRSDSMVPLSLPSKYLNFSSDMPVGINTGKKRSLEYIQDWIRKREELIINERNLYGDYQETYDAVQSLLAWNTIYDPMNERVITPVSRIWNEAWGGWVLFDWDTYFTAAMFALDSKYLAFSNLLAITGEITDDGFIPNFSAALSNGKSEDRSQPPVGSLITRMIYEKYPEKWVLEEVYDNLLSWNRWWEKNRDNEGYLSWGSLPDKRDPGEKGKQAAMYESGLDNSPLFDDAVFNEEKNLLDLGSVGLMSLYITDCKNLAEISGILKKEEDRDELLARANKYGEKLKTMWDEESGIYRDIELTTGTFSKHLAPTNFYPLLAGVPEQAQAEAMIQNFFMDPDEFYGDYMLPSISRSDPAFNDNSYWRGRIWAPMNFLVYLGLRNYDLPEARKILAERSNQLLMQEWVKNRRIYENYNAGTGEGSDVSSSDAFYTWGGLLGLIKLMEEGYWDIPEQE